MNTRQIKFRAWDRDGGFMWDDILIAGDGKVYTSASKIYDTPNREIEIYTEDNGYVMQFTGLLDKNGKEIFEGDIINDGKSKMAIKFKDGRFIYDDDTYEDGFGDDIVCWNENGVVIGNIYENPELLK